MNPVRDSVSRFVQDGLEHVTIHEEPLDEMAQDLSDERPGYVPWNWPPFPNVENGDMSPDELVDYLFLGNTINFQFRNPDDPDEKYGRAFAGEIHPGAMGMWAGLHQEYDRNPAILEGETLAELTETDVERIFSADVGIDMPMIPERTEILNETGDVLADRYDGRFHNLVHEAEDALYADGDGIVERLVSDIPGFDDAHEVDGRTVNLYKRAQLTPAMALGHFAYNEHNGHVQVEDSENFTIFADYNLPNIFRDQGVLEYTDDLADRIDAGDPLTRGSREEVELRTAAVYVADMLADRLDEDYDVAVNGAELDGALFEGYRDEVDTPIHFTETIHPDGRHRFGTIDY